MGFWLAPAGGFSTYRMSEVNGLIRSINSIYRPPYRIDEISSGASLGVRMGADIATRWFATLGYERLWAGSSGTLSEYDFPADLFEMAVGWRFLSIGPTLAGFQIEAGAVSVADGHFGPDTKRLDLSGTGSVFGGGLALDGRASRRIGLILLAGYRRAKIDGIEANGVSVPSTNGTALDVDYSGILLRLGLRITVR